MRVRLLGPLEVQDGGRAVDVGGARLRTLLSRLALDAGRPVGAAALVDAVWEDDLPADEVHALQSLVSRLRRGLGDPALVTQDAAGYRLAVAPEDVDAQAFERLAGEGSAALRAGDPARAAAVLREALALWRGPALAGLADQRRFAGVAAARLEELRLAATLDRIEADLALGSSATAALADELASLAAAHPLDERVARHRIRALAAAGRQADALAAYEEVRTRLDEELGALPGPELQAAHVAVLRGEREAPAAPAAPVRPSAAEEEEPVRRRPARTNLRTPLTSFVGRDRELTALGAALSTHRLVTLLGPGGAGKTRLAQEAAARCVDAVPDGVWLAELAPVREAAEIAPVVLAAVGLRDTAIADHHGAPAPPADPLERLVDLLAGRRAVLVLDNCEHLVEAAAAVAEELLGRCPDVRILATSREPLGVGGEQLFDVPPLAWPGPDATPAEALAHPAVELFADRAAAARPGFAVDAENVGPVVEICRRLDGQPLAIELAAARLRSLPPAELAARLDDRFRLLTGGSRTALPRHRTLRAVVDWSWDLLTPPERALARRLAVFAAGATAEAAEAVCAGDELAREDVFDALASLVDRSLVQVVDASPPRYRMLETIREYGLERLDAAGETAGVRAAHAHHFAELAATLGPLLRTAGQLAPFRTLTAERENLVAALRHLADTGAARAALSLALELTWVVALAGEPGEAVPLLRLALEADGEADPDERTFAEVIVALADANDAMERAEGAGHPADVAAEALSAMAERLAPVDPVALPLAPMARAMLLWMSGARDAGEAVLEQARAHPDPWVRAVVPLMRAQLADNEGDVDRLRAELDRALPELRAIGDRWPLALALIMHANVDMLDGDLDAAGRRLEEGDALTRQLTTRGWTSMLGLRLAELQLRRGDTAGATASLERMEVQHDLAPEEELIVLATRARVAGVAGDDGQAQALRTAVEARLRPLGQVNPERGHGQAVARAALATLLTEADDLDRAEAVLADAHPIAAGTRDMPILALVGLAAATLAERRGRSVDAAEMLGAAAQVRGSDDGSNPEIARLAGRLRAALGDDAYAAAYARGREAPRDAAIARLQQASDAAGVRP